MDIQFDIDRKLAGVAVWAQIIGTGYLRPADHGKDGARAQFLILCMVPARAGPLALLRRRDLELQQLTQGASPGSVEGRPEPILYRFQIGVPAVSALRKDAA